MMRHHPVDRALMLDSIVSGLIVLMLMWGALYLWFAITAPETALERCAQRVYELPLESRARLTGRPLGSSVSYLDGERWCSIVGPWEGERRAEEMGL